MSRLSESWTHFHDAVSLSGAPRLLQVDLCHLQYNSRSFTSDGGIVNTHPGSARSHSETVRCSFGSITASEVLCPGDISSACTIYTSWGVKNGVGNNSGFRVESFSSWNVQKEFLNVSVLKVLLNGFIRFRCAWHFCQIGENYVLNETMSSKRNGISQTSRIRYEVYGKRNCVISGTKQFITLSLVFGSYVPFNKVYCILLVSMWATNWCR